MCFRPHCEWLLVLICRTQPTNENLWKTRLILIVNFFVKNKDWGRGGGDLNREGGLINFPPLKRGDLFERGGGLNRGFTVR